MLHALAAFLRARSGSALPAEEQIARGIGDENQRGDSGEQHGHGRRAGEKGAQHDEQPADHPDDAAQAVRAVPDGLVRQRPRRAHADEIVLLDLRHEVAAGGDQDAAGGGEKDRDIAGAGAQRFGEDEQRHREQKDVEYRDKAQIGAGKPAVIFASGVDAARQEHQRGDRDADRAEQQDKPARAVGDGAVRVPVRRDLRGQMGIGEQRGGQRRQRQQPEQRKRDRSRAFHDEVPPCSAAIHAISSSRTDRFNS